MSLLYFSYQKVIIENEMGKTELLSQVTVIGKRKFLLLFFSDNHGKNFNHFA